MININALKYRSSNHFYFSLLKLVYVNNLRHKSKIIISYTKSFFLTLNNLTIKLRRINYISLNYNIR